jgi:hypothetical protein
LTAALPLAFAVLTGLLSCDIFHVSLTIVDRRKCHICEGRPYCPISLETERFDERGGGEEKETGSQSFIEDSKGNQILLDHSQSSHEHCI